MTQEIKFRAWDGKLMFYPETINFKEAVPVAWAKAVFKAQDGSFVGDRICNSKELMQFTGLLDKNGKEIYEGDVVGTENAGNYIVEWGGQADQAAWMLNQNNNISWLNLWANRSLLERIDLEIIGNIYESPSLTPIGI